MNLFNAKKKTTASPIPYQNVSGVFSDTIDSDIYYDMRGHSLDKFRKMSTTDAVCGAVMLALTEIFQTVEWKVYDDPKDVVRDSLVNVNWNETLEDVLSFLVYGHSLMETTLAEYEDGRVLWSGMYHRPSPTLVGWKFDSKGRLQSVKQMANGKTPTINARRCLLFNTTKTQSNPLGKSLFRNAYRDWHYKTNIEKVEAMGIERDLTGLPVLKAPESETLTDENGKLNAIGQWAWTVVRSVKRNKQEGLVLPDEWEFELVGSPGQRQFDLNNVINRYSSNMALSMLSQFLVLGVTNTSGSFALAKEQSSLFNVAVQGFAYGVANVLNRQFIGIPALALYNNYDKMPYIKPVGFERIELNDLASFLGRLLKFNVITPDDKLEEWLRDKTAMPPKDEATSRVADVKLAQQATNN